eukprot:10323-Heterococcus_DN1.PRE.1
MSCLFQAIGRCIGLPHERVRRDIVDYMQSHADTEIEDLKLKSYIEFAEDVPFEQYVSEMRKSSTWGGEIEMSIACLIYDLNIVVFFRDVKMRIGEKRNTTIYLHYTGNHFEAILKG